MSEAELGSLARAGDVQALTGLLERCRPALYATAIGLLGNRADALDAVQDTFVIALVRLAELRDPGAAPASRPRREREAITVGVRATIMDVLASGDITILEIDFRNPAEWPGHCPPHATFVHRLSAGRTRQLQIHYPAGQPPSGQARPY